MPRKIRRVKPRPTDGFVISRTIVLKYQTKTFFAAAI